MNWFIFIVITLGTFLIMEGITWLTHRFIMHGFLWYLHEDHHKPTGNTFEKNDAFFFDIRHTKLAVYYAGITK